MEYRLNRFISSSGYCSRREADELIERGRVTINGKRAKLGDRVLPKQRVMVDGLLVAHDIEPVYIAFNKPLGIVCTTDPEERDNIVRYIGHEHRIFPIGRLDKDSQGLILLTNDGEIVNKILREENNNSKEYRVTVDRPLTDEFMHDMAHGVPIMGQVTRKCELERLSPTSFKITLTQGLNRQIRRMCEHFLYNVVHLQRVKVMNVELGRLVPGEWRDLTEEELETLFDMLEESEKAGVQRKRKSPSTLRHEAKRHARFRKTGRYSERPKQPENKPSASGEIKGVGQSRREASGKRVGKQRVDKLSQKNKTQLRNQRRKGSR